MFYVVTGMCVCYIILFLLMLAYFRRKTVAFLFERGRAFVLNIMLVSYLMDFNGMFICLGFREVCTLYVFIYQEFREVCTLYVIIYVFIINGFNDMLTSLKIVLRGYFV